MSSEIAGLGKQKNIGQADLGLCPKVLAGVYTVCEAHSEYASHAQSMLFF